MQLDEFLQPTDAPVKTFNDGSVPWKIGVLQTVQQNRVRMSQANIKNFVQLSGTASASGAIGSGTTLFLNTTLSPNIPHQLDINYALPYIAVYQGTAATTANQIYPVAGTNITPGAYTVVGGLDYNAFGTSTLQTNSVWTGMITDNSAGNQTILFASVWRYLQYNNGTVT